MRCWSVVVHWGPPCSDDPVSNSAVTGALVAGRAVTKRRRVKRHSRDIPQAVSVKVDIEQAGGRCPHKKEMSVSKLPSSPPPRLTTDNIQILTATWSIKPLALRKQDSVDSDMRATLRQLTGTQLVCSLLGPNTLKKHMVATPSTERDGSSGR